MIAKLRRYLDRETLEAVAMLIVAVAWVAASCIS